MKTQTFRVGGMTCVNCQNRIERALKDTVGIEDVAVDYNAGTATVSYNASVISFDQIKAVIERLDYTVPDGKEGATPISRAIGILAIIFALYIILRIFSTSSLVAAFPVAQSGMSYGMVLIIGLLTSVHCIAMCGGINLSQTLQRSPTRTPSPQSPVPSPYSLLSPSILYNMGRLISYTAVGVAVGALGSVVTVSGRFQGAVLLLAGIFMLVMGINMLGLFPSLRRFIPRLPTFLTQKISSQQSGRGPLVVGILNGFMPCGPLQAMQLYALSTGSPLRGGISMFLFCAGTIPLMFALGAAGGVLSGVKGQEFSRRVIQVGAVLIAAMGLTMFANGWNLAGLNSPLDRLSAEIVPARAEGGGFVPVIQDGKQIVNSTLLPNRYPAIVVQQGIPVRWTINAPPGSINGCNDRCIIREYGIEYSFKPGDNVIEFLPTRTGRFPYSCWMGMIRSTITVVAEGDVIADVAEPAITPVPAGVEIPTDEIALAQIRGNFQAVEIRLTDDGFEPAIVVVQRRLPVRWNINIDSLDPGSESLIFPAYYSVVQTQLSGTTIQIMPSFDFEFSTGDNVFYGYVKVVDDIGRADLDAIKTEVASHETLIYPDAYFEAAASGGGCACCR